MVESATDLLNLVLKAGPDNTSVVLFDGQQPPAWNGCCAGGVARLDDQRMAIIAASPSAILP
jgi:hypothetical protein